MRRSCYGPSQDMTPRRSRATTCRSRTMPAALRRPRNGRMRIGLARNSFFEGLDPQIRQSVDRAVSVFAKLGAEIHEVTLPESSDRTVIQAEAYAYHAAQHGGHAGTLLAGNAFEVATGRQHRHGDVHQSQAESRPTPPNRSSIFRNIDAVLTPTTPVPPPKASELPSTFDEVMANDAVLLRNTRPFNLLAFPTISIPCGFTDLGHADRSTTQRSTMAGVAASQDRARV